MTNLPSRRAEAAMARYDTNHDSRISLDEFYQSGPPPLHPRMKQVFDAFATNATGTLSYAEAAQVVAVVSGLMPKLKPDLAGAFVPVGIEVSPQTSRAILKATVNGVEGRFLLDTGTSDTIVHADFARRAGVDFVEICSPIVSGNYGKKGEMVSLVRVPEMQIGQARFRDFHAVLRDDRDARRDLGGPIDGIIGANILFARPLTLDYHRQTISFPTNFASLHEFTFTLLPEHRKTAAVQANLDGVPVILMFDSGAAIGETILVNERYHPALRKLAGDPAAKEYRARAVSVNGVVWLTDQRCRLMPFEESVIGAWFFRNHVITVDTQAARIWIDSNR